MLVKKLSLFQSWPQQFCQWDLSQPEENFAWADEHWATYSTNQDNIHLRLLNLLSPDVFSGVKLVKNALAERAPSRVPVGAYSAPQTYSWRTGSKGEGKGRETNL